MSPALAITAGAVLLAVVGIAYGGTFLLQVGAGKVGANDLQKKFFRAGHAHAGVLVTLGLVVELYLELAEVAPLWRGLGGGVLYSAILIPAGFFLSVLGRDPARPGRLMILLWLGVASLVIGLVSAAIGLITVGVSP